MLKLDLARLEREKKLRVDAEIPSDDPLWVGSDLAFRGPLRVGLVAQPTVDGGVIVRGAIDGTLAFECRRCLEPVEWSVERDVTLVWTPIDELGSTEDDGDSRTLHVSATELDLGVAIREELILGTDRYRVCDSACRGLCPQCGTNLNEGECDCTTRELDPRWDVLRTLKTEG